ncbi:uncharacterized protein YjdB [Kitasatospora sp. MAP12-15]|uniref:hypothetical protein n=1 Tax=unclassified Kitasatospora TaxID=2633591 RepID=UPI002473A9F2|nr:hypothetical protein [Kitasatospora sp. MAP12-44]MDH6115173.1 uncharacterized protein YjdB [Kitasatospora sp. MAP12-44]
MRFITGSRPARVATLLATGLLAAGLSAATGPTAFAAQPAQSAHTTASTGDQANAKAMQQALAAALQKQAILHPNDTGRHICYAAQVQNIGWQAAVCDGQIAGTVGQSLRLEALNIAVSGVGGVCAQAHVQNIGWQNPVCGNDGDVLEVGTVGMSLRMEALSIMVPTGSVCADAHVQNIGWQGTRCQGANVWDTVGTVGQSLRMEAIALTV